MRRYILLAGMLLFTSAVFSQERDTLHKRDMVNTDTLTLQFDGVNSGVTSIQITAKTNSGALTGTNKVYLYATDDVIGWQKIDSLVMDNSLTINTKLIPVSRTHYYSYKTVWISQGTVNYSPWFTILRRKDEALAGLPPK